MGNKEKRFVRTYVQGGFSGNIEIWVDKETGVNYIYKSSGYGGGLAPLLDAQGNVVVTKVYDDEE